jgi:Ser/Thr protein kinase RdoA (MazF antagonist)
VINFPARLLQNWDIAQFISIRVPQLGTMNDTWLLEWPQDRAVLRRHRRSIRAEVEFEHRVLGHARSHGVPCPAIIPTLRGDSLVEDDAQFYSLYTWASGLHVARGHIADKHAQSLGSMLAHIHRALADLSGGPEARDPIPSSEYTLGRIDDLMSLAQDRPDRERASFIINELTTRSRWLSVHHRNPPSQPLATSQVIHGDYQDTNVFFANGEVSCVIDWDKARREVPARELVRALDYALGMDPVLCQQFLAGYRAIAPITPDELEGAADWFSYQQAHNLWLIEQFLLHDNDRVRGLIEHKPFKPFWQLWTAAGLT